MSTISLCMIVKNEEVNIEKCLNSIADLVDEVVVVDTGSTDKTKELVQKYPNMILYDFEWVNDFAKARNFAFSKASKDYQMWMDADEELLDIDRERFRKLREAIDKD